MIVQRLALHQNGIEFRQQFYGAIITSLIALTHDVAQKLFTRDTDSHVQNSLYSELALAKNSSYKYKKSDRAFSGVQSKFDLYHTTALYDVAQKFFTQAETRDTGSHIQNDLYSEVDFAKNFSYKYKKSDRAFSEVQSKFDLYHTTTFKFWSKIQYEMGTMLEWTTVASTNVSMTVVGHLELTLKYLTFTDCWVALQHKYGQK